MSYTVILDELEREKRSENRINETFRHCRIGRVLQKVTLHGGKVVTPRAWYPDPIRPPPPPFYSGGYVHPSRSNDVPPPLSVRL